MMSGRSWLRLAGLVGLVSALAPQSARAQVRFTVDSRSSLGWWQVVPHMGHLWATTCPQDTNWYSGALHSPEYRYRLDRDPMHGHMSNAKAMAETPIPIFPRATASIGCTPAVRGDVAASDSTGWRGLRGLIIVQARALVTGNDQRDRFARDQVLDVLVYPDIRFVIDSLTSVEPGDTISAVALGTFELHGVKQPWSVPIKAWRERLGMRVIGQWSFPAADLISVYKMSQFPLSLGVGMHIWRWVHMGFDLVLVPESEGSSPRS
jgi:hypothetical protein